MTSPLNFPFYLLFSSVDNRIAQTNMMECESCLAHKTYFHTTKNLFIYNKANTPTKNRKKANENVQKEAANRNRRK